MQKPFILLLFTFMITACGFPGVYKINVQQGNIVTQDMLDQLKPGMNRRQVHFALGNPVIHNTFDSTNESYVYSYQHAGGRIRQQQVTVFFEQDQYTHYSATLLDENPAY